ncbi:MAG TPA: DinB family protein [Bryobacterales bacterium]|nr:DinB family protein [Bryobacterales bacterium]
MSALREWLERLERGIAAVEAAIGGASDAELDYAPAPDKWTARQVMAHLADAEMVGADRLRRVIAEDNPTLVVYDEKAWAANLDYHRRSVSQALETFRHARTANYELLKELPEAVFARTGMHTKTGPISLGQLLEMFARHAEDHARQIERNREQFRQARR